MLDSTIWTAAAAREPRRPPASAFAPATPASINPAGMGFDASGDPLPTLPVDGKSVRFYFELDAAETVRADATQVGYTEAADYGLDFLVGPIFARSAVTLPDARPSATDERFFVGGSEVLFVVPPTDELVAGDWYVVLRWPGVWLRADLAEVIFGATAWRCRDNGYSNLATHRAHLSEADFLAYSKAAQDPRQRQALSIWWEHGESVGQTIARALRSTDALASFATTDDSTGALSFLFALYSPASPSESASPFSFDDAGVALFALREPRLSVSTELLVNVWRRTASSLLESGPTQTGPTSPAPSLPYEENAITLRDDDSVADFGVSELATDLDHVADWGSTIGPARLDRWKNPPRSLEAQIGPLGFALFPGRCFYPVSALHGLDGSSRFLATSLGWDFDSLTVDVEAIDYPEAPVSTAPSSRSDLALWYKATTGTTYDVDGTSLLNWADQSSTAADATPFAGKAKPQKLAAALNGYDVLRFGTDDGLEITDLPDVTISTPGSPTPVKDPQSFLLIALVRRPTGAQVDRPLFSIEGGEHRFWFDQDNTPDPTTEEAVVDDYDGLAMAVGPSGVLEVTEWHGAPSPANGSPLYAAGSPPSPAETSTKRIPGAGEFAAEPTVTLPENEWRVVVFQLEGSRTFARTSSVSVQGRLYQVATYASSLAVLDPEDPTNTSAANWIAYGVDGRGHEFERLAAIGRRWDLGTYNGNSGSLEIDVAELQLYTKSTARNPWTPDEVDGLVSELCSRWGY